jgi:hypothetical protein
MTSFIDAQRPFSNIDIFAAALSFTDVADFFGAACVCKRWNGFADDLAINHALWKGYSESKGIPMVSSKKGIRNCRNDFRAIYPMTTVSGEVMRKLFGEPVGEVPCISADIFNKILQPDPFDSTKLQRDTWEFIVEYPFIFRVLDHLTPLALNEINDPALIPFTLRNRIMLCDFSLVGKEHTPVFDIVNEEVLAQNDYCPMRVNVYYQRKKIVNETRGMPYLEQKAFVEERGSAVMPLGPRVLSDAVLILLSGTCPDVNRLYARTSSSIWYGTIIYQSDIGGFAPRSGATVDACFSPCANVGVAVGIRAEAL